MLLAAITQTKHTVDKYATDQQDIKKAVMQMAEQSTHSINEAASPSERDKLGQITPIEGNLMRQT